MYIFPKNKIKICTRYSKPKSTYLNGKLRRLNIKQKKKYCQAVIYTSKDKFAFLSALFLHYWWCIEASTNFTCVSTEKVWQIKLDAKSRVFSQIKRTKKNNQNYTFELKGLIVRILFIGKWVKVNH